MDKQVKNHRPSVGTDGSREILMDERNPTMDIVDGISQSVHDSQPDGGQSSRVAMEEDVPSRVGSHDSGHGIPETRNLVPSLDWTEGNPYEKEGAGIPMERMVVDNVDSSAVIPPEYADPQILTPMLGQRFKTERDAYNFYNVYAVSKGFGIRLDKDRMNTEKQRTMRQICCSHQGRNPKTKKPSVRIGCPAMMKINRSGAGSGWSVTKVVSTHNHPMKKSVGVTKNYQSHNQIDEGTRGIIEEMVDSSMSLTNMYDNCPSMAAAIRTVFPNTIHRVCKWHVLKKAKEFMGNIYSKRHTFKKAFHKVLTQTLTEEEFVAAWHKLIRDYNLEKSVYLRHIWDIRRKWAFVYFSHRFFAGMTTTQRSESANHVFKMFVSPSSSMNGFVKRYDRFFNEKLQKEDSEEFQTSNDKVEIKTRSPIEIHASQVYTRAVFQLFSEELTDSLSYMVKPGEDESTVQVVRMNSQESFLRKEYQVSCDLEREEFSCVCKMFEHKGILCSHILRVLVQYGLSRIPERYILKRWTKDARDTIPPHLHGYKDDVDASQSRSYRHVMLNRKTVEVAKIANKDVQTFKMAMTVMNKLLEDMKNQLSLDDGDNSREAPKRAARHKSRSTVLTEDGNEEVGGGDEDSEYDVPSEDEGGNLTADILPPLKKKSRGRPKVNRYKSGGEVASLKRRKEVGIEKKNTTNECESVEEENQVIDHEDEVPFPRRFCHTCHEAGHNSRTCGRTSTYKRKL
ncbi:Os04g0354200 [Oryza sativa Japonica Group]|uniref:Protein FAR1-RELATED SEQUENCE n=1 Tax=Oryza sativa subsp. japonica TaxID=39947 RepID=Q0JDY4_ORYSJ|nr:Os04g0354200 [Oryza sativa Japonica Group]|eukprot:NP_001052539.2 Os04g0354200 [Oryza sativa Japonica Group]